VGSGAPRARGNGRTYIHVSHAHIEAGRVSGVAEAFADVREQLDLGLRQIAPAAKIQAHRRGEVQSVSLDEARDIVQDRLSRDHAP